MSFNKLAKRLETLDDFTVCSSILPEFAISDRIISPKLKFKNSNSLIELGSSSQKIGNANNYNVNSSINFPSVVSSEGSQLIEKNRQTDMEVNSNDKYISYLLCNYIYL